MKRISPATRRRFLRIAFTCVAPLTARAADKEPDILPVEDLMREHGILNRVLLIYAEAVRRLDAGEDLPPAALHDSAKIIRHFIEDYHEKLEEDYLFPRCKNAGPLARLAEVLLEQHLAGRNLTDVTLHLATTQGFQSPDDRRRLLDSLRTFIRMYHPHEAHEDTVLFPAFRRLVSPHEYAALGEDFEKRERELFGRDGFETMVGKVVGIEKQLGLDDLARFTPK